MQMYGCIIPNLHRYRNKDKVNKDAEAKLRDFKQKLSLGLFCRLHKAKLKINNQLVPSIYIFE